MKYLRKIFESDHTQKKDIQETIDEVLDNLGKKGKLSKSEKEFMDEASTGTVKEITTPSSDKKRSFWNISSDPHELGVMWIGKDGSWKRIIDIEEEKSDEGYREKQESDDQRRNGENIENLNRMVSEHPELKDTLNELAIYMFKSQELRHKLDRMSYQIGSRVDGVKTIYGLMDAFGPIIDSVVNKGDGEGYKLRKKK